MTKYNHSTCEAKWQKIWQRNKSFVAHNRSSLPKFYVLDMFPYPSGSGLHVGHVVGYTATDIIARYKRQKGFNVLHPMGWDSFGLPAEQYAIRTGAHPKLTTEKNIDVYRKQLQSLGFSYDWSREITTSEPNYYKWTQWIFTELYKRGLAYEAEALVNYCPALGTVLANEEVENGRSKEGNYPVERRPLKQWVLRITAYAERLLSDLESLNWPESIKRVQKNWIGKSSGAKIVFESEKPASNITVFTTAPHTLFGVTFLAISPEHSLVDQYTTKTQREAVHKYQKSASQKSDLERTELSQEKTGVWTGSYVRHPITGNPIPVWIADYVIMGYGTGAVMGVPGHDSRDFVFAKRHALPILSVISPLQDTNSSFDYWEGEGILTQSDFEDCNINGLDCTAAKETVINWLEQHKKGERAITYKLRDWLFSRQRYWGEPIPILHFPDGTARPLDIDELPLVLPEISDYTPSPDGLSLLSKAKEWVHIVDKKTGKGAIRETNTMPQWAGSCWYYLRFCDPHNAKAAWGKAEEKYWMPVDLYVGGVEHAVLHLLYARFWHKVLYDIGHVTTSEPFQSLRNQGLVIAMSYKKPGGGYVSPNDVKQVGDKWVEISSNTEVIEQVEKMSKSKLNGVNPDEIIAEFGADSLRLYSMFMAPFDKEKLWNTRSVQGCSRFLCRLYDLVASDKVTLESSDEAWKLGHRLVNGVERDINQMQFNTAIAKMMEFLNHFSKLPKYPKQVLRMAVQVIYPFAPHICEELWEKLGEKRQLATEPFPAVDAKYLEDAEVIYIVQVNGRLRARELLPKGKEKDELIVLAKNHENVKKFLQGTIKKVIFVPDKLINFVIE
ncbi:MAG: leucine--tRNA ligase [Chlamydiales bacterium]